MSKTAPSQAELAVLKHLWSAGDQSAREVHKAVEDETGWSYSTTRTLLTRMVEKELVAKTEIHGLGVYQASVDKVALMGRLISNFTSNILEMDQPLPATSFANSRLFTEEEAEALTRLLEEEGKA